MSTSEDYTPPPSSAIASRQNDHQALRLLIAQRRLYRKAKRWLAARWAGMVVLGIGAPVVSVIWPSLAVACGAVAGVWIFLGRSWVQRCQARLTDQAAAVQEQVDFCVFEMPTSTERDALPSHEEIARIVGPDEEVDAVAAKEKLVDWYPIDPDLPGILTVAIAQRANAEYSRRLIQATANTWTGVVGVWIAALVALSAAAGLGFEEFLVGVALPVLPAFLDVAEHLGRVRRASADRDDLVRAITRRIEADVVDISPEDLLVWQANMFDLRRQPPDVPDWIYRLTRKLNEQAMKRAARELGERATEGR